MMQLNAPDPLARLSTFFNQIIRVQTIIGTPKYLGNQEGVWVVEIALLFFYQYLRFCFREKEIQFNFSIKKLELSKNLIFPQTRIKNRLN